MGAKLLGCETAQLSTDAEAIAIQQKIKIVRIEGRVAAAEHCNDVRLMEQACDEAELAGVSMQQTADLRKKIRRIRAEAKLEDAERDSDIESMDRACIEGEAAEVDPSHVARVRLRLTRLRAKKKLETAARSDDLELMEQACNEAAVAGVDAKMVQQVKRHLLQMHAEAKLKEAVQSKDSAVVEEAYKMAVVADLEKTRVAAARMHLAHVSAEKKLDIVESGTDVEAMLIAARQAEAIGVDGTRIAAVRSKAERTLASAEALLKTGMCCNNAIEIMEAWEAAVKVGIVDDRVACLRRRAKKITEERLQLVLDCENAEEMETACKDAECLSPLHAGIDSKLVGAVRRKSKRLRAPSGEFELRRSVSLVLPSGCC